MPILRGPLAFLATGALVLGMATTASAQQGDPWAGATVTFDLFADGAATIADGAMTRALMATFPPEAMPVGTPTALGGCVLVQGPSLAPEDGPSPGSVHIVPGPAHHGAWGESWLFDLVAITDDRDAPVFAMCLPLGAGGPRAGALLPGDTIEIGLGDSDAFHQVTLPEVAFSVDTTGDVVRSSPFDAATFPHGTRFKLDAGRRDLVPVDGAGADARVRFTSSVASGGSIEVAVGSLLDLRAAGDPGADAAHTAADDATGTNQSVLVTYYLPASAGAVEGVLTTINQAVTGFGGCPAANGSRTLLRFCGGWGESIPTAIRRAEAIHLRHHLSRPRIFSTGSGETRDSLVIRVECHDGTVGWGETYLLPGARTAAEALCAWLVGQEVDAAATILDGLGGADGWVLSAVRIAVDDVRARQRGIPLSGLYGERMRTRVRPYASSAGYVPGVPLAETWIAEAATVRAAGFAALKLRIGREDPGLELAAIRVAQTAVSGLGWMADVNEAWSVETARQRGPELAELGLRWLEEPIPAADLRGYTALRRELPITLAGGEGTASPGHASAALGAGAYDLIQPDASICGGIGPSFGSPWRPGRKGSTASPMRATGRSTWRPRSRRWPCSFPRSRGRGGSPAGA